MENERIAKLEVEVGHLRADVSEIKTDVKSLLEFKWNILGAAAVVAVVSSGAVLLLEAVVRH